MTGLAQKYRPRRFRDVVGQESARFILRRAVSAGRVPQQLLLSGGSGLGKTTLARITAAAMLCERPDDGDACGECRSCHDVFSTSTPHPDVIEFDAASYGNKEQIKELAQRALVAPMRGRHRVYIIDEAQGLSAAGSEAFLTLLESPPAHVHFMLATTDPDKMLRTVRGRCVEFVLHRPTDDELSTHLSDVAGREGVTLPESVAYALLRTTGFELGVRGLLMALDKVSDALAWGEHSDADVIRLLGLAPQQLVDEVWQAVRRGDPQQVATGLGELRAVADDTTIRRAFIDVARRDLAAHPSDPRAVARLHAVLSAASGPAWTEVTVIGLAHTDARASAPGEVLPSASGPSTMDEPSTSLRADHNRDAVAEPDSGRPAAKRNPQKRTAKPSPSSSQVSSSREAGPPPSRPALADELISQVSQRDKTAAALLRACRLEVSGRKIRVCPADDSSADRLKARAQVIKDVAASLEVTLTMSRPT